MKNRIIICILIICNFILVLFSLFFSVPILLTAFFFPVILDILVIQLLCKDIRKKSAALLFLIFCLILTVFPIIFCFYCYNYNGLDDGGFAFVLIFTFIFNTLPCLITALVYFLIDKSRLQKK